MLEANGNEMRKGVVLVVVGTNDMSNTWKMEIGERIRYLEGMENALNRIRFDFKGGKCVPHGSASIEICERSIRSRGAENVASCTKISLLMAFHKRESRAEFLERGLVGDGIHYTDDRLRFVPYKALQCTRLKVILRGSTERIDPIKVWPDRCWVCGQKVETAKG